MTPVFMVKIVGQQIKGFDRFGNQSKQRTGKRLKGLKNKLGASFRPHLHQWGSVKTAFWILKKLLLVSPGYSKSEHRSTRGEDALQNTVVTGPSTKPTSYLAHPKGPEGTFCSSFILTEITRKLNVLIL